MAVFRERKFDYNLISTGSSAFSTLLAVKAEPSEPLVKDDEVETGALGNAKPIVTVWERLGIAGH
jgi:hypothetical protein